MHVGITAWVSGRCHGGAVVLRVVHLRKAYISCHWADVLAVCRHLSISPLHLPTHSLDSRPH